MCAYLEICGIEVLCLSICVYTCKLEIDYGYLLHFYHYTSIIIIIIITIIFLLLV